MAKLTLIICILIPSILAQCNIEKARPFISRSVFEFSTELIKRIAQETENHFIASTLSPWTLLAYTSLGATDNSYEELVKILRLHRHSCFMNKFFDVTKEIYTPTAETSLEGASAIFVDENIQVNDRFQEQVRRAGLGDIKQVAVDNYEYVAATINNYVKTATNGAIDEIVVASDLENVVMMIVDALRFKGTWENPFPVNETQQMPFYDEMNNEIGKVNLMTITDNYNTRFNNEINATVVELPYSDRRFSMLLFVPYSEEKLNNVIDSLKKISVRSLFKDFEGKGTTEVNVRMPRFKISSDLNNLKELLIDMGLRSIFDPSQASFPKIADYPLYISNLIQKADIEVTEEGTIASAATQLDFSFKSFPTNVDANKPFFFMIVDKKTYIPVFAGAYSKPSVY
ncbi:serine protease inhibitor 2.1 [Papilio machaon]|uniref:serine protease inhibitor 2.1 n=1 Tax=Papilio machaon TaxID=76193 RepID=UPI001E664616|nr:serine protease inhibitor 2.1 [Papilio machaon]